LLDLIRIESSGVARFNFPDILDTYSFYTGKNGRTVYRSTSERYYLYYEDWGSNQGSNWIVSMNYNKSENLLTSPNVENLSNFCVDNVNKVTRKPWLVKSELGWLQDVSLRIQCVKFQDATNQLLTNYKQKLRKKHDINRNKLIYNY